MSQLGFQPATRKDRIALEVALPARRLSLLRELHHKQVGVTFYEYVKITRKQTLKRLCHMLSMKNVQGADLRVIFSRNISAALAQLQVLLLQLSCHLWKGRQELSWTCIAAGQRALACTVNSTTS